MAKLRSELRPVLILITLSHLFIHLCKSDTEHSAWACMDTEYVVLGFSTETKPIEYTWNVYYYYYTNWLFWLWRLRMPTICRLQTGEPGKPMEQFNPSPKAWEPWEPMVLSPSTSAKAQESEDWWGKPQSESKDQEPGVPMSKGRRRWVSQLKQRADLPFLHLFVLFSLHRLDGAHPHWWGWSS